MSEAPMSWKQGGCHCGAVRSKPDGFSVNVRCLDDGTVSVARITLFDGAHWEEAMTTRVMDV